MYASEEKKSEKKLAFNRIATNLLSELVCDIEKSKWSKSKEREREKKYFLIIDYDGDGCNFQCEWTHKKKVVMLILWIERRLQRWNVYHFVIRSTLSQMKWKVSHFDRWRACFFPASSSSCYLIMHVCLCRTPCYEHKWI